MREFEFIRDVIAPTSTALPKGVLGIGDDCSVVPINEHILGVTTTDCLVEDIHFSFAWMNFRELGYKSLAVSVSDILAMGARPKWAHVSIALPARYDLAHLQQFYQGFNELSAKAQIHLLGGDLSRSPAHLFVNVCVSGEVSPVHIKYRRNFTPGQMVAVVGPLGDAAAGLKLLMEKIPLATAAAAKLKARQIRPDINLEWGPWLGRQPAVGGMMDCSDGLLSALQQLAIFYGVGFRIDVEKIPVSEELKNVSHSQGWDSHELATTGGEDYSLIFSVDSGSFADLQHAFAQKFGHQLSAIGEVTQAGLKLFKDGLAYQPKSPPFAHF